jgi:predicted  nucleic acid-binding Zn ribbon protein
MYCAELRFHPIAANTADELAHLVHGLLAAMRMNGQVCGREWPITIAGDVCRASVLIPEPSALDPRRDTTYVRRAITELAAAGLARPECIVLGPDIESSGACACARTSSYILYTNHLSLEPPVCCGDCFRPIPLVSLEMPSAQPLIRLRRKPGKERKATRS